MADSTTTLLPKVRTYARDLAAERSRRGLSSNPKITTTSDTAVPKPPIPQTPTTGSRVPPTTKIFVPEPAPIEHIVVAPEPRERVSEAVVATRNDDVAKATKDRPTTIPSLQTLVSRPIKDPKPVESSSQNLGVTIDDDESGAMVITDTKRDRFNLLQSVITGVSKWWQHRQRAQKIKKMPRYVVPDTVRRKGVIQQATSHTGKQITNDRVQLRDLIEQRESASAVAETETIWTPNTETIFPLLDGPRSEDRFTNVTVTHRTPGSVPVTSRASNETVPPAPVVVEQPEPAPQPIKQNLVEPIPQPVVTPAPVIPTYTEPPAARWGREPISPVVSTPVVVVQPEPVLPPAVPIQPEFSTRPAITPTGATTPRPEPLLSPKLPTQSLKERILSRLGQWGNQWPTSTNSLALSVVGLLIVVVVGGMGVRQLLSPSSVPVTAVVDLPLQAPLQSVTVEAMTRNSLIATLLDRQTTATQPQQLIQFLTDETPTSPQTLLNLLDPTINPQIVGQIKTMYFGWHDRSTAFVVFTVFDRSSTWGGLLASETNLDTLFSPFLTDAPLSPFTDERIGNFDVRSASGATGSSQLVYGFINDQTLLVTKDAATFLLLSSLTTPIQ